MEDKDIIKALERCSNDTGKCSLCPMFENCETDINALEKHTLDLINRLKTESNGYRYKAKTQQGELARLNKQVAELQAEIERLTVNMNAFGRGMQIEAEKVETAKAEAIKEFAERLKAECFSSGYYENQYHREDIDNLVKEMVGDAE